jgi:hypothetical protein
MKKLGILSLLIALITIQSGCLSHSVIEGSKQRIAIRRAIATNNEIAIQALKNGESPAAAGINVSAWEAIKERPILQTGAAVGDGFILWGGIEGVQWLANRGNNGDGDGDRFTQEAGRDTTTVNINGDGNRVQVRGDASTVGGTDPTPTVE